MKLASSICYSGLLSVYCICDVLIQFYLKHPKKFTNILSVPGDVLEDYPDSPGAGPLISGEDASHLLDTDDTMEVANPTAGCSTFSRDTDTNAGASKRTRSELGPAVDHQETPAGPSLPPIYHSVHRKKTNKLAVRHLDGGALNVTEGTMLGAPVCLFAQVGSFSNVGDKRHNLTVHRHDHATLRNISMSFDPTTFTCKSCQGAHSVLRRTIEGGAGLSPRICPLGSKLPSNDSGRGGRGMC
jgi:hypothetical protein